jgi:hypothetical protein
VKLTPVTAGDWKLTFDRYQPLLMNYKTFDDFLKFEKANGHYDFLVKNGKMISGK